MPIYMDRHDVPGNIHAEHVAEMHQQDMKIQHLYGCKGITYWCDEDRRTAFCLIEAPNKQALKDMHDNAHGDVPHQIIEVDDKLVEAFLGRIEDPENTSGGDLNVIRESAFRIIMLISFEKDPKTYRGSHVIRGFADKICAGAEKFEGRVVEMNSKGIMLSFVSPEQAVNGALGIHELLEKYRETESITDVAFTISLSAGSPVTDKEELFGETISLARRMCIAGNNSILVTSEVRELYEDTEMKKFPEHGFITVISPVEKDFLCMLMDYTEKYMTDSKFRVEDLSKNLGCSKSQLYRMVVSLTGSSPNAFIRSFRLRKALSLLDKKINSISEIAFDSGFNSPSYFSRCFFETYGILPSDYARRVAETA